MSNTIAFLVKKPAQFDVPFFTYIARQTNSRWKWVVIYLESPQQVLRDNELKTSSDWGINLTDGYTWECLGEAAGARSIEALYRRLQVVVLLTNGYKFGYAPYLAVARALKIPMGLRIDSVLTGKSWGSLLLRKWLMRRAYRHFNGFFTTGKMGYTYLDYVGISRKKQFWFPYCADNDFFAQAKGKPLKMAALSEKHGLSTGKPVVLGVCKFIPRENPADLLEAFIRLNDTNIQLVMIGDGGQAAGLRQKAALHPHLSIYFPGYVPYTELPFWYALARVFVHPAQDEPWGVSVQEALAAGCSVVASNKVGSAYDLVLPGKNGFIYPVNHPDVLADDLRKAAHLSKTLVAAVNAEVLGKWNYGSVWEHMQQAAAAMKGNIV